MRIVGVGGGGWGGGAMKLSNHSVFEILTVSTDVPDLRGVPMPTDKVRRGEHDLLFISPSHGVLVVSVKSVGGNFEGK